MTENHDSTSSDSRSVQCPAALDPVIRSFVMIVILLGFGLYSFYEIKIGKYADKPAYLYFTWAVAVILTPLGAYFLGKTLIMLRQVLMADQDGIGYKGQAQVAWSEITRIVVRGKGLIDLHYSGQQGDGVIKLDSWKLKNFKELTELIESKTADVPTENQAK